MSVSSSRYPLIRISKTGEMRLKNKVGNAILKENAYEDRALNTRLDTLSKHQFRQDKYMTYRQLEFATKQVSASEERPRPLPNGQESKQNQASDREQLPPIDTRRRSNIVTSSLETNRSNHDGEAVRNNNKAKGRWEKAITLVRLAVQKRETNEGSIRPVAGHRRKISGTQAPESLVLDPNQLPPIHANEGIGEPLGSSKRKAPLRKQPSLPEMLKLSREKTQKCLEDPRFMRLEQCLSETKNPRETRQQRRNSRKRASPDRIRGYTH